MELKNRTQIGSILSGKEQAPIETTLKLVESMFQYLQIAPHSRLDIYIKISELYMVDRELLPEFTKTLKGPLVPLSAILDGTPFSESKVWQILHIKGVVRKDKAKDSNGKFVYCWVLEREHALLGQNTITPDKPTESTPMWYTNEKEAMLKIINTK